MEKTGLVDSLTALRADFESVRKEGEGRDVKFQIKSIDLEVEAVVTLEGGGKAGIPKWWLFSGEVEGKGSKTKTQKMKISLGLVVDGVPDGQVSSDQSSSQTPEGQAETGGKAA